MTTNRRSFIKKMGVVGSLATFSQFPLYAKSSDQLNEALDIHVFSKHLQFLNYKEAAEVAAEIGFKGLDLTVRPKGHVLPENVKEDLPKAISEVKKAGLSCEMITTAISDASNPLDRAVIETAAAEGVKFYRSNWFKFKKDITLEESLDFYKEKVKELSELNKVHNIIGCYQNHSGTSIGASIWEVKMLLEKALPEFFGAQYDIRHAVVEGGRSWSNGVKLLKKHVKTIVLKDFKWEKVKGKWQLINVPMGEGMVDFNAYFKLLKSLGLKPPVCLHFEYPLGGADKGRFEISIDHKVVFDAMKRDLAVAQQLWEEA